MIVDDTCRVYEQASLREALGDTLRPGGFALTERALAVCALPAGARVCLLGEAAAFYYPPACRYNTTWDRWPFDGTTFTDPTIDFVLIDFGSISRYVRSGYAPPGITPEAVRDWMTSHTTPIRTWPDRDMALVKIRR